MSVTIHDVAPATQARCEKLIAGIERMGRLPLTLLIVPRYHHQRPTPRFERWIETRVRLGDELALHGLTHLDEVMPLRGWVDHLRRRWYTAGEGEFAALGPAAARHRLEAGRRWFMRRGWPMRGFVAPAWLLGAGAWSALRDQPFEYTCTLNRLIALPGGGTRMRALNGWSIVFSTRTAWRRQASLAWNGLLIRRQRDAPWMRFELHPGDAEHASVSGALSAWLERARAADREALTLGSLAERMRGPQLLS
jgi:predicted deacetylase